MKNLKSITSFLLFTLAIAFNAQAQNSPLSKPINTLISNYLDLKDALVTGNGDATATKARVLLALLNKFPETGLPAAETAFIAKLKYDSRHISEVNRVAHQREHFGSLSNNLFDLLKKQKVNQVTLYWEFSTGRNAYFLSNNENSKDPYTGLPDGFKLKEKLIGVLK